MTFRGLILSGFIASALCSCKTKKVEKSETFQPQESLAEQTDLKGEKVAPGDSLFVSLSRTPCYGRCPIYKLDIYDSGYSEYEGKHCG